MVKSAHFSFEQNLTPILALLGALALALAGSFLSLIVVQGIFILLWIGLLMSLVGNRGADGYAPSLFLFITFTVFIFSRVLISLVLGIGDYKTLDWMIFRTLDAGEAKGLVVVLSVFILGAFAGFHRSVTGSRVVRSEIQMRLGLLLMMAGAPFCLIKAYHAYKLLGDVGYMGTYLMDGGADQGLVSVMASFAILGFYMFAASGPRRKSLMAGYVLFLFMIASTLALGSRGTFVCNLIAGTWLSTRIGKLQFRPMALLPLLLGLMVLMDWFGSARLGKAFEIQNVFLGMTWFVYTQGVSLIVPAVVVSGGLGLGLKDGLLTFLTPLEGILHVLTGTGAGQSAIPAANSTSLAAKISYALNPGLYAKGFGIGTALIAEAYLWGGLVGVFLAGVLIFKLLGKFHSWGERSAENLFVFSYVLPFILFLPRETTFFFLVPLTKALLFRAVLIQLMDWSDERAQRTAPVSGCP